MLDYILTLFAPFFGGVCAFWGSKLTKGDFFSKDYTKTLKGLCCLIVIYVHFPVNCGNRLQDAISSFGYVAVTIFFLVSAYGMLLSSERKVDYLKHFWRNRLVSLLIPAFFVNVVVFIFTSIRGLLLWQSLYEINGYVFVLLQFCVLFYIVEWMKRKWFVNNWMLGDGLLITGVVVSSFCLYIFAYTNISSKSGWCFERMGLVWGILLYRYFDRIKKWMDNHRLAKSLILCAICSLVGAAYLKYKFVWFWGSFILKIILGFMIIMFLFTATSNRRFNNYISLWLGNISYEVYLSHGLVIGTLAYYFNDLDSGWFILFTVILTLILSTLIHTIDKPIVKVLRYKPR